jgi:hypothetical protein
MPNHFFHKVATAPGDTKTRVARFKNPIAIVKHVAVTPPPSAGEEQKENLQKPKENQQKENQKERMPFQEVHNSSSLEFMSCSS